MHKLFRRSITPFVATILTALVGCSDPAPQTPPPGDPFGPLGNRTDLPAAERMNIDGLSAPVDVIRDKDGRPHICASTIEDAVRVEGYLVAQDRHLQVEFFR